MPRTVRISLWLFLGGVATGSKGLMAKPEAAAAYA
jgi:hypothetical protein